MVTFNMDAVHTFIINTAYISCQDICWIILNIVVCISIHFFICLAELIIRQEKYYMKISGSNKLITNIQICQLNRDPIFSYRVQIKQSSSFYIITITKNILSLPQILILLFLTSLHFHFLKSNISLYLYILPFLLFIYLYFVDNILFNMNHIQKLWLNVLQPIIPFVNEKLAKKSGILGQIGRFYSFGPRQLGYHPSNKYLALINQFYVQIIGISLHRYSFTKHLNGNLNFNQRTFAVQSLLGPLVIFTVLTYLTIPEQFDTEEGTTLQALRNRNIPAHYSSLNDRVSAHYTEINSLYSWQMMKRFDERIRQVEKERSRHSEQVKKTKFARPGYVYIEAHKNAL